MKTFQLQRGVAGHAAASENQLHALLRELGGLDQLRRRRAARERLPERLEQRDRRNADDHDENHHLHQRESASAHYRWPCRHGGVTFPVSGVTVTDWFAPPLLKVTVACAVRVPLKVAGVVTL